MPWWPPVPWDTYEVQRSANPGHAAGLHNANAAAGMRQPSPAHGGYRATVQTTDRPPPPPTQGARQPGWGERRGPGEHPGERVGARGRGRGRARGWHTRVTARHRQGGQTYRQGRQREGEWEGRQAREGAQGSGTRVTRRRAWGTRRLRGSSKEREHRTKKKKNSSRTGGHTGRAQRGGSAREVGGTGGQRGHKGTQCLTEKHHADDPHRAVPAAPPDHQGTDGGAAGGRGRRGSPPEPGKRCTTPSTGRRGRQKAPSPRNAPQQGHATPPATRPTCAATGQAPGTGSSPGPRTRLTPCRRPRKCLAS